MRFKNWKIRNPFFHSAEQPQVDRLAQETGLTPLAVRFLLSRGYKDTPAMLAYLKPDLSTMTSPFRIRDLELAVQRVAEAREKKHKIRIYGDYDVDGTCGTALLSWVFREIGGFDFSAEQPDRFRDGYGIQKAAMERAVADGVQVLISIDCGITGFDAAEVAKANGIDFIVIDHHQVDPVKGVPPAFAVVNPQRADCESGLKQLCGCGLGFYFSVGLRAEGKKRGWFEGREVPNLKKHLDLVVMATAADLVPLVGDNRVLVTHGLSVLKETTKPGVRALLDRAGLSSRAISPSHLGFTIGPRINASGRIQSASLALELLTTESPSRAWELADQIEEINSERMLIQNRIWDEVRTKIEAGLAQGLYQHGIMVADPGWHEGVVGIVASKVTEVFQKPAAVVAIREGTGKGSVRSFGGRNVLEALRKCAPLMKGFGGHHHAAGLSADEAQIPELILAFDREIGLVEKIEKDSVLWLEGEIELKDLALDVLFDLEKLGPYGPGNPEPVFSVRARLKDHQTLKGRHLKVFLENKGIHVEGIWFSAAERLSEIEEVAKDPTAPKFASSKDAEVLEWAAVAEVNRFRGRTTASLRIRDVRRQGDGVASSGVSPAAL